MSNNIYIENGYETRGDYLNSLADEYGISADVIFYLADVLGPDEDFDGLICELEDHCIY